MALTRGRVGLGPLALDLDQQRHAAGDQIEEIGEREDVRRRGLVDEAGEVGGLEVADAAARIHQTAERQVVEDHRGAIGGGAQVALDAVAVLDGGLECRACVLDHPLGDVVQAAVGNRANKGSAVEHVGLPVGTEGVEQIRPG